MKKYTVVTHSRTFHVDEIMAIVLLDKYLLNDYELIRTRDPVILEKHKKLKNSFVVDVGYEFDSENNNFDHHQGGFNPRWDNGIPLSSCGLVWKHLWNNTSVMKGVMSESEKCIIENNIIKKVDAQDNGVGFWDEGKFLLSFNRSRGNDNTIDGQFKKALVLASDYFDNYLLSLRNKDNKCGYNTDVAVATALLNKYLLNDLNKRIKEYDLEKLKPYVLDVGLDKKWDDGSACGLCGIIWHYLWEKTSLMPMSMNEELKQDIEEKLIKKIDNNTWKEGKFLKLYDKKTTSSRFLSAANHCYFNQLASSKADIYDNKEIRKDIKRSMDVDGIVILSKNYKGAAALIASCCDKDLFIIPHSKGQWVIQSVPKSIDDLYSQKCPMPKSWGGLNDDKLSNISGINNMVFCHKGLFMSIFKGTQSGAIDVANKVLSLNGYKFGNKNSLKSGFTKEKKSISSVCQLDNKIKSVEQYILKSKDLSVVVLNKKMDEDVIDYVKKTGKSLYMYPKGDTRWFICSIDPTNKFIPKEWKRVQGEDLFALSGMKGLCKCEKSLNACIIKGSKDEALKVANGLEKILINKSKMKGSLKL
jgi:uncharacterized UPF0160 family protein